MTKPDLSHITQDLRALAVPISEVVKDPGNLRLHSTKSVEGIRGSLAKFTQRKPIVVNKRTGVIEAGNGTLDALIANGKNQVAVVWVDDDPLTASAYAIADNRTAELSEWDVPALKIQVEALGDYEIPGVDQDWLDSLHVLPEPAPGAGAQDDVAPPTPPADPVSKQGEVYELGPHRLACGDCRDPDVWDALLAGEKINVAITSPPYASQRKYDESSGFKPIRPEDYVDWWEQIQANVATHLAQDGSFFVNIKEHCDDGQRVLYVKDLTIAHVRRWGWRFVDELCWITSAFPISSNGRFKNGWEPVFHFVKCKPGAIKFNATACGEESDGCMARGTGTGATHDANGQIMIGREVVSGIARPSNVLRVNLGSSRQSHAAPFPVGLPEFFVKSYSDKGDLVLDPFLGSGTTLIAAARNGRRCFGMEISPAYCDVIRKRWGDWARKTGVATGTGAL